MTRLTRTQRGRRPGEYQDFLAGHNRRTIGTSGPYMRVANSGQSRTVHLVIAETALGRRLPDGAEVHHVDGDKKNNRNGNLVICQDHAYHSLLHTRAKVVRAGGNPNTQAFCRKCRACKDLSEFHPSVKSLCKACMKDIDAKKWQQKAARQKTKAA